MLECLIYNRYSPRPIGRDIPLCESLDFQESYNRQCCERHGLTPIKVINDPQTSARITPLASRVGGAELVSLAPRVGRVVSYSLSRLFRNLSDGVSTMHRWTKKRVIVYSASQGTYEVGTVNGFIQCGIQLLIDEAEARISASRTSDAMRYHSKNGRIMGDIPLGFEADPDQPGRMRENGAEQALVSKVLELAKVDRNPRHIAAALAEAGFVNREGRPVHHETVRRILKRGL